MKKLLLPLLFSAICLAGCTPLDSSPVYHTIDEEITNDDDKLVFKLTEMKTYGIVYPGTKDIRPVEFYVTVNNNNTSESVYFSLRNYEWILHVGEYKYACQEVNGTKDIAQGGKGVVRPWFDVPDTVWQAATEVKLKMNRPYRSLLDTVKYEIWWKLDVQHQSNNE